MRRWETDGSIEADSRYPPLVRWLAGRGFFLCADCLRRVGL